VGRLVFQPTETSVINDPVLLIPAAAAAPAKGRSFKRKAFELHCNFFWCKIAL